MDTIYRKMVLVNHCRARIETHIGNAHVDMELGEEEEGRISWEITTDLYTVPCAKTAARGNLIAALCLQSTQHHAQARRSALWWHRVVRWEAAGGRLKRQDICIHKADDLRGKAESNTILQNNYIPILKKKHLRNSRAYCQHSQG